MAVPDPQRVSINTHRWHRSLTLALAASLAMHLAPLAALRALFRPTTLDLEVTARAVEIGLETAQPGAANPAPPAPPAPPTPPAPPPSPPTPPTQNAPTPREDPPPSPRSEAPVPDGVILHPRPVRVARPRPPRPAQPRTPTNANTQTTNPTAIPSMASAAGSMLPMLPRGALVTLHLRMDHLRDSPNASRVQRLLENIPDWDAMFGGAGLDLLQDVDSLTLAAANPFGAEGQPPDWFVLARGADGDDRPLRRAIEHLALAARAPAPSPVAPPSGIPSQENSGEDAGANNSDAGFDPWTEGPYGTRLVQLNRYGAQRSFVLLGDGMAAIALPGQIEALAAARARRTDSATNADPRLVLLLEVEGLRNLLQARTSDGSVQLPSRLSLATFSHIPEGARTPDGGARLLTRLQFDSRAQAQQGLERLQNARERGRALIQERFGAQGGLAGLFSNIGAGLLGIDVLGVSSALDALEFRVNNSNQVEVNGTFTERQVNAVLGVAALGRR